MRQLPGKRVVVRAGEVKAWEVSIASLSRCAPINLLIDALRQLVKVRTKLIPNHSRSIRMTRLQSIKTLGHFKAVLVYLTLAPAMGIADIVDPAERSRLKAPGASRVRTMQERTRYQAQDLALVRCRPFSSAKHLLLAGLKLGRTSGGRTQALTRVL